MVEALLNALKGHAAAMDRSAGQARFGTVASVDPASYAARVLLQPEGVLSGWLPLLTGWVGAGWGLAAPPLPGDQVLVLAQEGDAEHGVIVGRAFSDAQRPPPAAPGELWLVHRSGSFLKLCDDGTVEARAVTWNLTGDLVVEGTIRATGDITDGAGALSRLRQAYDTHTHSDSHGDVTGVPVPQD